MSVHYIVDGYNAIGRLGLFEAKTLMESRCRLCATLEARRPQGSARNKVTVVFDGSARVAGGREPWFFDVVYSVGEKADDVILKCVRAAPQPRNCVVVTDDKGLAFIVKKYGAAVMDVGHFFGAGPGERSRHTGTAALAQKVSLNIAAREKITQELSRIWLKEK